MYDLQEWGLGADVGGDVGWGDKFLRSVLHTISISLQNSSCESHAWKLVSSMTLKELNAYWVLPLYSVCEDEKTNRSDERSVKPKNA